MPARGRGSAAAAEPIGFPGSWTTLDCPSTEGAPLPCDDWDGSVMTLHIGTGSTPRVTFQDSVARSCVSAGSPSARWVGAGIGTYEDIYLFVDLDKTGCGTYQMGSDIEPQLYWDPGSDTLWEDEDGDGIGVIWQRADSGLGVNPPMVGGSVRYGPFSDESTRAVSIHARGGTQPSGSWTWTNLVNGTTRRGTITCVVVDGTDAWLAGPETSTSGDPAAGALFRVHDGGEVDEAVAFIADPGQTLAELESWCQARNTDVGLFPINSGNFTVHEGL